jgi:hypothetical protein
MAFKHYPTEIRKHIEKKSSKTEINKKGQMDLGKLSYLTLSNP